MEQAVHCLDDNVHDHRQHQDTIGEPAHHFRPHKPITVPRRGRLAGKPGGKSGKEQGKGIGGHVAGIGQQGE
jgi:hypothetical protein